MSKKTKGATVVQTRTNAAESKNLIIIVTLSEETPGLGTILVQRADLATVDQFAYDSLDGVMQAIQRAAEHLMDVESNPPNVTAPKADVLATVAGRPAEPAAVSETEPVETEGDPTDDDAE